MQILWFLLFVLDDKGVIKLSCTNVTAEANRRVSTLWAMTLSLSFLLPNINISAFV